MHCILTEKKTGKVTEYYVRPDQSFIEIGHSMCAGEFSFIDGEHYEISFGLMDAFGNENDVLTDALAFTAPVQTDNPDEEKIEKCSCVNQYTAPAVKQGNEMKFIGLFIFMFSAFAAVFAIFILRKNRKSKKLKQSLR